MNKYLNKILLFTVLLVLPTNICAQNIDTKDFSLPNAEKTVFLVNIDYPLVRPFSSLKSIDEDLPEGIEKIKYTSINASFNKEFSIGIDAFFSSGRFIGVSYEDLALSLTQEIKASLENNLAFEIHRPISLHSRAFSLVLGGLNLLDTENDRYFYTGFTLRFLSQHFKNIQNQVFRNEMGLGPIFQANDKFGILSSGATEVIATTSLEDPISKLNYYQLEFILGYKLGFSATRIVPNISIRLPVYAFLKGSGKNDHELSDKELWDNNRFYRSDKIKLRHNTYLSLGLQFKLAQTRMPRRDVIRRLNEKF